MADFPTLPHLVSSQRTPEAGIVVDYTEGGGVKARRLYTNPRFSFRLVLAPLTSGERDTLLSHYDTHKDLAFLYTWPEAATSYTCIYQSYPAVRQAEAGAYYVAEVGLEGV